MGSAVGACGIEVVAVEDGIVAVQYLIQPRLEAFAAEEPTDAHPMAGDALIPRVVSAVVGDDRCGHLGSPRAVDACKLQARTPLRCQGRGSCVTSNPVRSTSPLTEGAAAGGILLSCVGRSEEPRRNRTAVPGALPASALASRVDAQAGASLPALLGAEGEALRVGHDDVIQQRETDELGGIAQRRGDDAIRARWCRVGRWMVVADDQPRRVRAERWH